MVKQNDHVWFDEADLIPPPKYLELIKEPMSPSEWRRHFVGEFINLEPEAAHNHG